MMMKSYFRLRAVLFGVALVGTGLAAGSVLAGESEDLGLTKEQLADLREKALLFFQPIPEKMPGSENDTPERIELGEKLFFDKRLSKNNTISCNSCHAVDNFQSGADGQPTSPGAFGEKGGRNSPTVLNAGFHFAQFWDGRAETLEEQAKGPILNPIEMAMPEPEEVLKRLQSDSEYPALFAKAFLQDEPQVNYDNLAKAIASFERTLITRDRFDDFLKGDDQILNAEEIKGMKRFMDLGCVACHNGAMLGANSFQKTGLVNRYDHQKDLGRYLVTGQDDDKFRFKVPSLRNVALTAPYFHDGKVATLDEAVKRMAWMQIGLKLDDADVRAIVAFLNTLSDKERSANLAARAN